ncbi:hypothetical protein BSKO_08174 [Bryopsis sp. KO-2023]|nr:hypothetical protein BSKO_08174 [Bryopsis sp. KO-2023]
MGGPTGTEPHLRCFPGSGADHCVITALGPSRLGPPNRQKKRFLNRGHGVLRKNRSLCTRLLTNVRCLLSLSVLVSMFLLMRFDTGLLDFTEHEELSVDVVGVAVKPTCVTQEAIKSLNQFFGPRRIIIITTSQTSCNVFRSYAHNVICRVENTVIPGVTVETIDAFLESRYDVKGSSEFVGRNLKGWYLQQFIKLGAAQYLTDLSEHFLVWDMDMILLKGLSVFRKPKSWRGKRFGEFSKQAIVNIGGRSNPGYEYSYKRLTGKDLEYADDGTSFVTHWIVVYKPFMKEFLDTIGRGKLSSSFSHNPNDTGGFNVTNSPAWVWRILDNLDPGFITTGFSEYASYVSWVKQNYPNSQHIMKRQTWLRHPIGGAYTIAMTKRFNGNGLCCPVKSLTGVMKLLGFQYMGFEIGHVRACQYTNAKYRDGYGIGGQ